MRILDKYLTREFLKTYIVILLSISLLFIVIDIIDKMPKLLRNGASIQLALAYYSLRLPYLFVLTSPVTVLLTGLFLMNSLAKYHESVAVRAAGISIKRMVQPILLLGFVLSSFIGVFSEYVLPRAESYREYVYRVLIKKEQPDDEKLRARINYVGKDNNLYYIGFFDGYRNQLKVVDITHFNPKTGEVERKIVADGADWLHNNWVFRNCTIREYKKRQQISYQHFASTILPFVDVTPVDFIKSAKQPLSMNYFELRDYIKRLNKVGEESTQERVDLFMKISYPLANFIILFFCVPLAATNVRSKGRGIVFLIGLMVCFAFMSALRVSQSLGYNQILPPLMAAWLPNIVFLSLGLGFLFKSEI